MKNALRTGSRKLGKLFQETYLIYILQMLERIRKERNQTLKRTHNTELNLPDQIHMDAL